MNWRQCLSIGLVAAGWLCGRPALGKTVANAVANPYTPIVERNVFGLVAIPTNPPVDPSTLVPPPKITPNGIMTIFGRLQVLFKVAGEARPGQPPKDESYVMSEGERQNDIEVQKIDEKSATITFDNHGVIQELPLVAGAAAGGAPPAGPAALGRPPGLPPLPGVAPAAGGQVPVGFGSRFGRGQNNNPNGSGAPSPGAASPAASAPAEPAPPVEQQIIMIEAQRLNYLQQGDSTALIMPPTELTQEAVGGGDGGTSATPPEDSGGAAVTAPGH